MTDETYTPQQIAAFTSQLKSLDAAISTGAEEVNYPDRGMIRYRSLAEIRSIRADLLARINTATLPTPTRTRRVVVTGKSGW